MAEETKTGSENKAAPENKTSKEADPVQKILDNMPEWVTPLLSALGSMGGSYLFFIKPLQERLDTMANQLSDLQEEVKELKQQNRDLEKELEAIQENQGNQLSGYLPVNKLNRQGVKKRI